jgi:ribosome-binding factor A
MTAPFKKESHRREKVAGLIKQEVSRIILQELNDPRAGFCTVTRVSLSGDMKTALIHVSVLGEEAEQRTTMRGLEHARGFIQRRLFEELELRHPPVIRFQLDHSIERSIRITQILREEGIPDTDGFGAQPQSEEGEAADAEQPGEPGGEDESRR